MIFESAKMRLKPVRTILENAYNEVLICENLNDQNNTYYTTIIVKDHEIIRSFIEIYERDGNDWGEVDYFTVGNKYIIVYPYMKERPLSSFYVGGVLTLEQCEEICRNLIISCMVSSLPWPILYLVLTQDQVNLAADNGVYLSYIVDMDKLDINIVERDCVLACADILVKVLEAKSDSKADSYVLLKKKTYRGSYETFTELYKDVDIASVAGKRQGIFSRIAAFFRDYKDQLFRVLLVICVILLVFTIVTLVTNAIFGDVPWLWIFTQPFEQIGKESLLQ